MIGFQTGPGAGGREGLKPRSRWFDVTKWQALAVRQVARELRISHVWSWGWAQRDARSNDPDKTLAACVWLWSRDASLCDAPRIVGRDLDRDVATGQLNLPAGTRCVYGTTPLTASSVAALAKVTRDRELALTTLVVRAIERERARVSPSESLALEQRIVRLRFGGSAAAYRSALSDAGASASVARGIVGDELRARELAGRLSGTRVSAADVARFRATFAPVVARELVVAPSPSWLPGGRGVALATSAPESVFRLRTGRRTTVRTVEGVVCRRGPRRRDSPRGAPLCTSPGPRSCASSRPSAVRMRTRPGRSACRRLPRASSCASETGCPSSASSTAPRTRRSSRSPSPRPTAGSRLAAARRRRERAASRRSRPCRVPSSSRARGRRLRGR